MQSRAASVKEYLAALPDDRRKAVAAVRKVILDNLGEGYAECMQYGMIGYCVPHARYPAGYHCDPQQPLPFAGLASQKNHLAVYLFCVYAVPGEAERFAKAWKAAGKRLDMGKGCVRFRRLEDVPLDVLGEAIRRVPVDVFIKHYEAARDGAATRRAPRRQAATSAAKRKRPAPKRGSSGR